MPKTRLQIVTHRKKLLKEFDERFIGISTDSALAGYFVEWNKAADAISVRNFVIELIRKIQ